jgi:hypothetical protein
MACIEAAPIDTYSEKSAQKHISELQVTQLESTLFPLNYKD